MDNIYESSANLCKELILDYLKGLFFLIFIWFVPYYFFQNTFTSIVLWYTFLLLIVISLLFIIWIWLIVTYIWMPFHLCRNCPTKWIKNLFEFLSKHFFNILFLLLFSLFLTYFILWHIYEFNFIDWFSVEIPFLNSLFTSTLTIFSIYIAVYGFLAQKYNDIVGAYWRWTSFFSWFDLITIWFFLVNILWLWSFIVFWNHCFKADCIITYNYSFYLSSLIIFYILFLLRFIYYISRSYLETDRYDQYLYNYSKKIDQLDFQRFANNWTTRSTLLLNYWRIITQNIEKWSIRVVVIWLKHLHSQFISILKKLPEHEIKELVKGNDSWTVSKVYNWYFIALSKVCYGAIKVNNTYVIYECVKQVNEIIDIGFNENDLLWYSYKNTHWILKSVLDNFFNPVLENVISNWINWIDNDYLNFIFNQYFNIFVKSIIRLDIDESNIPRLNDYKTKQNDLRNKDNLLRMYYDNYIYSFGRNMWLLIDNWMVELLNKYTYKMVDLFIRWIRWQWNLSYGINSGKFKPLSDKALKSIFFKLYYQYRYSIKKVTKKNMAGVEFHLSTIVNYIRNKDILNKRWSQWILNYFENIFSFLNDICHITNVEVFEITECVKGMILYVINNGKNFTESNIKVMIARLRNMFRRLKYNINKWCLPINEIQTEWFFVIELYDCINDLVLSDDIWNKENMFIKTSLEEIVSDADIKELFLEVIKYYEIDRVDHSKEVSVSN